MIKNEIDKEVGRNDFSDCVKTYYQGEGKKIATARKGWRH